MNELARRRDAGSGPPNEPDGPDGPDGPERFAALVDGLKSEGYAVAGTAAGVPVVSDELLDGLLAEARAYNRGDALHPARVGAGTRRTLATTVRGDRTRWIDPARSTPAQRDLLAALDELRQRLNRELLLGLFEIEAHLALYPPGAHYDRHLDQLSGRDDRVVSVVLYLNRDWHPTDGGELLLHLPDGRERRVAPEAGTLVVFLSDQFPHAVLPTRRERVSVAAWLRRRPATGAPV